MIVIPVINNFLHFLRFPRSHPDFLLKRKTFSYPGSRMSRAEFFFRKIGKSGVFKNASICWYFLFLLYNYAEYSANGR